MILINNWVSDKRTQAEHTAPDKQDAADEAAYEGSVLAGGWLAFERWVETGNPSAPVTDRYKGG